MEVLGHALRDARMELDTLRSVSAGLEYDVRAYEVTLNRCVFRSFLCNTLDVVRRLIFLGRGTDLRRNTRCLDPPLGLLRASVALGTPKD